MKSVWLLPLFTLGLLTGCAGDDSADDALDAQRKARPRVTAVLDLRADVDTPWEWPGLGTPLDPMGGGWMGTVARCAMDALDAAEPDQPFDLDRTTAAYWAWARLHEDTSRMLPVDADDYFGSDWRTRRIGDALCAPIAQSLMTERGYSPLVQAADRARLPLETMIDGVTDVLAGLAGVYPPAECAPLFELLGELLAASGDRYLAWRAYRLALRGWIAWFARHSDVDDGDSADAAVWRAALASAVEGDLTAVNLLVARRDLEHADALRRANWCRLYMQQVHGEVGGPDDAFFSDTVVEAEHAAARDPRIPPDLLARRRLSGVATLVALGSLTLTVLLVPLVGWWRRGRAGTIRAVDADPTRTPA